MRMWLQSTLILSLCGLTACHDGREDVAIEHQTGGGDSAGTEAPVGEPASSLEPTSVEEVVPDSSSHRSDSQPVEPATESASGDGPFTLGEDIESPRRLGNPGPIEGLVAMMRSGDYAWGSCIFQVTISETGEVGEVVFLKPEQPAPEVERVIAEGVRGWQFSPAMRAGEPVAVYYNLVIHHCPLFRKDRGN